MSRVRFDKDLECNGSKMLRLENDLLRLELLPDLCGKIYRLIHKPENRDYLWQNPHIQPTILEPGKPYDLNFTGGWDEQFPNDEPCQHQGKSYPDHGEFWDTRFDWDVKQSDRSITLYFRADGPVTNTRMERWITLDAGSTVIRFKHRLTHPGDRALDYIWKFHPALAVGESHQILIPAGAGLIATPGSGRLADKQLEFNWPNAPVIKGSGTFCRNGPKGALHKRFLTPLLRST